MKPGTLYRAKRKKDTHQLLMLRVFAPDATVRTTSFVLDWIAKYRRKGKIDAVDVLLGCEKYGFVKQVGQLTYLADEKGKFDIPPNEL